MKKISRKTEEHFSDWFIPLFIIFFFAGSSIFDMSITFAFYDQDPLLFLEQEANRFLVWGINKGFPWLANPAILTNWFLMIAYIFSWEKFKKYKTHGWECSYVVLTCVMIFISAMHLAGGYSWLVAK